MLGVAAAAHAAVVEAADLQGETDGPLQARVYQLELLELAKKRNVSARGLGRVEDGVQLP